MQKYWFDNETMTVKIRPTSMRSCVPMNETTRQVTEIVKDPASYSAFTYAWVIILSMWGGIVRIVREVKVGEKSTKELVIILVCELITSGFAGVLTFYSCESAGFQPLYTAVMTSIAGYMGGRALSMFEEIYKGRK